MKLVKNALCNRMGDDYLSNSLICFAKKEMLDTIPNEVIVKRFHAKNHRGMKRKEVMCSSFYFHLSMFTFSLCLKMIFFHAA